MSTASIWIVSLPDASEPDQHAWASLSGAEQSRADRFRNPLDRTAYVHAHAALRVLLERSLGQPLRSRPFDLKESGKPWLGGASIGFSYSRSHRRAAVGIVDAGEVGVDIEAIVPDERSVDVARANFPPADIAWLLQADGDAERLRRFYRLWVIREAVLKATGEGLMRPLADLEIAIDGDRLELVGQSSWMVVESPRIEGYAAAAAIPRRSSVSWKETSWTALATS